MFIQSKGKMGYLNGKITVPFEIDQTYGKWEGGKELYSHVLGSAFYETKDQSGIFISSFGMQQLKPTPKWEIKHKFMI